MSTGSTFRDYVSAAMSRAVYDRLGDGSFGGSLRSGDGVTAFGRTLQSCQQQLRSNIEERLMDDLRAGRQLPTNKRARARQT